MSENHARPSNSHLHSPHQMSFTPGDDMTLDDAASGKAESDTTKGLPTFHPTHHFPADPSHLDRPKLEKHYREMRRSHKFLCRSRAQLKRRSRETKNSRQDLLDTIRHYEEQYAAIGRERVEQFELARELKQKLEIFEKREQDLDQLLSQVEDVHGEGGFWAVLKVAELLKRMRELFLGSGVRQ